MKDLAKILCLATILLLLCSFGASADNTIIDVDNGRYVQGETAWDLDFEKNYVGSHRWGLPYVQVYDSDTSSPASNSLGNQLTAHIGTATNSVAIEESLYKSEEHGQVLKLKANDSTTVQLNEFAATMSGSMLVYEMDFCIEQIGDDSKLKIIAMQPVLSPSVWIGSMSVSKDGDRLSLTGFDKSLSIEKGEWHKIAAYVNNVEHTQSYFIDGEFFAKSSFSETAEPKGTKLVTKLDNAAGTVIAVDNYKAYALDVIPEIKSVDAVGDTLDVEFSSAVSLDKIDKESIVVKGASAEYPITSLESLSDSVIRVTLSKPLPTAVSVVLSINVSDITTTFNFETSPADIDMKNVSVVGSGNTFSAEAVCHNTTEEQRTVVMFLSLFDDKGRVVKVAATGDILIEDTRIISLMAEADTAVSAKVFFMTDWESGKPFKSVMYFDK